MNHGSIIPADVDHSEEEFDLGFDIESMFDEYTDPGEEDDDEDEEGDEYE